jgi:hypothetical protein
MALDLLTDEAWDGKVERLYRHDCKSFVWVLLWVCCRYEGGKQINNPPLSELTEGDHNHCFKEKYTILSRLLDIHPTSSYESIGGWQSNSSNGHSCIGFNKMLTLHRWNPT